MSSCQFAMGAALIAATVLLAPTEASAKKCRPGGHLHHGTADGMASKSDAKRSAIQSWASFTDLEYGRGWSNFKNARYRKVSCFNREAGWTCNVEANPCRGRVRRSARK